MSENGDDTDPEEAREPLSDALVDLDTIRNAVAELDEEALSALSNAPPRTAHQVTTGDVVGYVLSGVGVGLSVADTGDDDGTSADRSRFDPPDVRIDPDSAAATLDFNEPDEGTTDWHLPLNENFELLNENPPPLVVDTLDDLRTHEAAAERLAIVRDTADLYVGDGEAWELVGRLDYTRRLSAIEDRLADIERRVTEIHDAVRADEGGGTDA